jgi:hypothetical protein
MLTEFVYRRLACRGFRTNANRRIKYTHSKHVVKVFENRILRRKFEPERDEMIGG